MERVEVGESPPSSVAERSDGRAVKKVAALAVLVAIAGVVFWQFGDLLSLERLSQHEAQLRAWQTTAPLLTAAIGIGIYLVVAGLSLPGAAALTLVYAWYFGFWRGLVVVSFGSTGGASIAFLISRYLLRDWVQSRMGERLMSIQDAFDREGAFYLFTLRLVPAVPFFVINALMGLTTISLRTFWWVSQLGMLPGTVAYVYAGASVPTLQKLAEEGVGQVLSRQLILAFAILGVLPLAIKRVMTLVAKHR